MFKVLVHGCQEARCKPLIHVIQTRDRSLIVTQELAFSRNEGGFPFRKPLEVIFVALRNFFETLDHTLVQGASTFPPKVNDFFRPCHTPVALLGQEFHRFRYFKSLFVAYWRWYLLVDRDLYFLQPGRVLIPTPSLSPQLSPKPACLFNVFKHSQIISSTFSRISVSLSLILPVPLQRLTLPVTVLNCWLIIRSTFCFFFFFCQTRVLSFRAPTVFSPCS